MEKTRVCVQCGKLYVPSSIGQKTCSIKCSEDRHREKSLDNFYERKARRPKRQEKIPHETYTQMMKRIENEKYSS